MIRVTFRKHRYLFRGEQQTEPASYYAVVTRDGRPMWSCEHDHPTRKRAIACGHRWVKLGAGSLPPMQTRLTKPLKVPILSTSQDWGRPVIRRSLMERLISCAVSEPDQGDNAAFGSLVHDCIYEYLLACVTHQQESRWSDLRQIVVNQFYRVPRGINPQRLDEAHDLLDLWSHNHLADLHTLMYLPAADGTRSLPALEYMLTADVGWATITGTVDRLDRLDGDDRDDPPRIVQATDYKTQWAATPHLFQGRTYAQLAFLQPWATGLEEFHWMPDPFKLRSDPHEGAIVYRRGDLDEWWKETIVGVKQRWDLRLSGRAVPTGGAACQYCALRYSCPQALPMARGIPENPEQAEELAMEWVRLDESAALRKESLAAYFKERAAQRVNGYEVGWLEPRDERFVASDPMGIVTALNAMGLDGASVLFTSIDKEKIPNHMKAGLVAAGVAKMAKGAATFKRRKAGAVGDES